MTGQTISHYRILEKLGKGSIGTVYKAEHVQIGRIVALKLIPSQSPEVRARFIREAQAAAAVTHPNLCILFEADQTNGFLATEFADGGSVADRLKFGALPLPEAMSIAIQACAGLAAAHDKGIVHRDIKPANIMLNSAGQVKIVDFGLAYVADRPRITQTGVTIGTPAYMSPEQVHGEPIDRRADIWALGVVLYEMVTGRRPFSGESGAVLAHGIIHKTPQPITAVAAALPPSLERIVARAMRKDRGERYQFISEMMADLSQVPVSPPQPSVFKRLVAMVSRR